MFSTPVAALSLIGFRHQVAPGKYVFSIAEDAKGDNSGAEGLHLTPQEGYSKAVVVYLCGRCWLPVEEVGYMNLMGWTALFLGPKV